MESSWHRLFDLAAGQGGVVTPRDVVKAGVARSTWRNRTAREGWRNLGGGVWVVPGVRADESTRLHAALAALGDNAALSHPTALGLHGLDERPTDRRIHVVVPHGCDRQPVPGTVRHRSRHLDERDVAIVDGLRTTSVARTIVDVAGLLPTWRIEGAMFHARHLAILDPDDVRAQLDRRPRLRGTGRVRSALALLRDDVDSILEHRTRRLLIDSGVPPADGVTAVDFAGTTVHPDLAYPEQRIAVECDGRAYHVGSRAFEVDRDRWRLLRQAGWVVVWVTWQRLHARPTSVVQEVRAELRQRQSPPRR